MSDTADQPIDWIARSGKRAKGRRPEFFDDPATGRLQAIVMALVGEVSVLRERLDTIERLLEAGGTLRRADIEQYVPDRAAGEDRALATRAYIARVMRVMQQELEAMDADDPPIMDWVEKLAQP